MFEFAKAIRRTSCYSLLVLASLSLANCAYYNHLIGNEPEPDPYYADEPVILTPPDETPPKADAAMPPAMGGQPQAAAAKPAKRQDWCYKTLAKPDCYAEPQDDSANRLVNVAPANLFPRTIHEYNKRVLDSQQ